jgi:hypothetical protein
MQRPTVLLCIVDCISEHPLLRAAAARRAPQACTCSRPHAKAGPRCTLQEAQAAQQQTNGFKMDKAHTWVVCMFDDFDKLERVPDEYAEAPPQEYKPMVRGTKLHCMLALYCGRRHRMEQAHGVSSSARPSSSSSPCSTAQHSYSAAHVQDEQRFGAQPPFMLCDVKIDPVRTLQENLQEWLMDPRGRDQFVVRHGDETEVRIKTGFMKSDITSKLNGLAHCSTSSCCWLAG